jgi:hypothetical membrane protein
MPSRFPADNCVQTTVWALYAAIAMPLIYFGTQLIAAPFYPGYSFAQDTASMLGTTTSRQPWIFNLGAAGASENVAMAEL